MAAEDYIPDGFRSCFDGGGHDDDFVVYDVMQLKHETRDAWLVVVAGDEYWLPKSQCVYNADKGKVSVPGWLVRKKNMP